MESSRQHAGMAVERAYRFVLWLTPTVEKFPRAQKYLLGDRMQSLALDVLEDLIEATYSRARQPILQRANLRLEKLRIWCGWPMQLCVARMERNGIRGAGCADPRFRCAASGLQIHIVGDE